MLRAETRAIDGILKAKCEPRYSGLLSVANTIQEPDRQSRSGLRSIPQSVMRKQQWTW